MEERSQMKRCKVMNLFLDPIMKGLLLLLLHQDQGVLERKDLDLMKERFAKLLLGEDMSGGGNGVSSTLALSNAITNLVASDFGEQSKFQPMAPERKARWKKEIDWLFISHRLYSRISPFSSESKGWFIYGDNGDATKERTSAEHSSLTQARHNSL